MPSHSRSPSPEEAILELRRLEISGQLAAHDLANILQAVQCAARLMERAADDPKRIVLLAKMLSEIARRGNLLTDQMRGVARQHHDGIGSDRTGQDGVCNPAEVASLQ